MGLHATVRCNCAQKGKINPFPVEALRPHVAYDEEGMPYLDLPYEGNEKAFDVYQEWIFDDVCEHGDLTYVITHIASWIDYTDFLNALDAVGWKNFPTLEGYLPLANDGDVPPEESAKALEELDRFERMTGLSMNTFLVDTETGDALESYDDDVEGIFAIVGENPALAFGVDDYGFFIRACDEIDEDGDILWMFGDEVFRSTRFEQRMWNNGERVEFYDAIDERRFICEHPLMRHVEYEDGCEYEEPLRILHTELRPDEGRSFAFVVEQLRFVFEASVEMGQPVEWG